MAIECIGESIGAGAGERQDLEVLQPVGDGWPEIGEQERPEEPEATEQYPGNRHPTCPVEGWLAHGAVEAQATRSRANHRQQPEAARQQKIYEQRQSGPWQFGAASHEIEDNRNKDAQRPEYHADEAEDGGAIMVMLVRRGVLMGGRLRHCDSCLRGNHAWFV